jgi:hypothetical protein
MYSGFEPDTRVSAFPVEADTSGVHIMMEVKVYTGGEISYSAKYFDGKGQQLPGCGDGSEFSSTDPIMAVLLLSHQMRSTLECARTSKTISQLLPKR